MDDKNLAVSVELATIPHQSSVSIPPGIPTLFVEAGEQVWQRVVEFFTAQIRNHNTRLAYAQAVNQFARWCEDNRVTLAQVTPFLVAAYIEQLQQRTALPTAKQHLAALRSLFDYMVVGQTMRTNPARSVRGPKYVVKKGLTPVLLPEEARHLLESIDVHTMSGLRDRALLAIMVYSFARVGAVVAMDAEDYFPQGKRYWFRLHEKGSKLHDVPAHHKAEEFVDVYLKAAGLEGNKGVPIFQTIGRKGQLTGRRLGRLDVLDMVKRRARTAGLLTQVCCHTFRATGITAFLLGGGSLEMAQRIANHESPRTTKLYDRTSDTISLDEIERIVL